MTKTKDTRQLILDVAFEQFLLNGYKSVTMSSLERETGLTKGAFYHYFKDKLELFRASIKSKMKEFQLELTKEQEETLSLKDFILLVIEHEEKVNNYFHCNTTKVAETRFGFLMADIMRYVPDFRISLMELVNQDIMYWEKILFRAREKGEIRDYLDISSLSQLFANIPESVKRNRIQNKSQQYALNMMRIQYNQLYDLIHK